MKVRRRKYKVLEKKEGYWPSFVDAMTAVTLVFFFIMLTSIGMTSIFTDNIVEKRKEIYDIIESQLTALNVSEDIISFNQDEGKIEIYSEVTFEFDSSSLNSEGHAIANQLNNLFLNLFNSDAKIAESIEYIEVIGHTDFAGSTINGRELSTARATSFLNAMMPAQSDLELHYGNKFKASGMSEFESYNSLAEGSNFKDIISKPDSEYNKEDEIHKKARKIELRIIFDNSDIDDFIKARNTSE